ncbi:MAG: Ger(x)C family spore germination protein [Firmicutes bacterium]|nr:Ger(x)C family spore germination protein [Bacillota bacterium]
MEEEITPRQLVMLLLIFEVGSAILLVPTGLIKTAGQDAWLAVLLAFLPAAVSAAIYVTLDRLYSGLSLIQYAPRILGRFLGRLIGLLYLWFFLHLGALVTRNFGDFITMNLLPRTPMAVLNGVILFAAVVAVRGGLGPMARTNDLLSPLTLLLTGLLLAAGFLQSDLGRLLPFLEKGGMSPRRATWAVYSFPLAESVIFVQILPAVQSRASKLWPYLFALFSASLLGATLVAMVTAFLGTPLAANFHYATFEVAKDIEIGQFFQRMEALLMMVWDVAGFFKIALCLYSTSTGVAQWLGLKDYRPLVAPLGLIMGGLSLQVYESFLEEVDFAARVWPLYSLPFEAIIPLVLLTLAFFRRGGKRGKKMGRPRGLLAGILLAFLLVSLTGCWDRLEIDKLALVSGLAVDREGENIVLTAQVVVPSLSKAGEGPSGNRPAVWLVQGRGRNLGEALTDLFCLSPRLPYGQHIEFVVFGESLAREGLGPLLDGFVRRQEFRSTMRVLVAPDPARAIIVAASGLEKIPGLGIRTQLQVAEGRGQTLTMDLRELMADLAAGDKDPVLPWIQTATRKESHDGLSGEDGARPVGYRLSGLALFRADRMVGHLGQEEGETLLALAKPTGLLLLTLPCPKAEQGWLTLNIRINESRIKPVAKGDQLELSLDLDMILREQSCADDFTTEEGREELKKHLATTLEKRILALLEALEEKKADPLGLGEALHRHRPRVWANYRQNWRERLAELRPAIKIAVKMVHAGLTPRGPLHPPE